MKKKIVVVSLILLLIATLSLTLVGCVGSQYDFSDFFADVEDYSSNVTYSVNYDMYTDEIINQKHLSGYLYELQYSSSYMGASQYAMYNAFSKRIILSQTSQEVSKSRVVNGIIDIVVRYKDGENNNYKYYLSDGQELFANNNYSQPYINQTAENSYMIEIGGQSKIVILEDNYYIISKDESEYNINVGEHIGSLQNKNTQELVKSLGLSKGYDIDITDNIMYVLKNKKIVSSFSLSPNDNFIAMNKGHIFYYEKIDLPSDSEQYDVIVDGEKFSFQYKSFNVKNGKTKNIKADYYINDVVKTGVNGDCLVAMSKINKDKTLSNIPECFVAGGKGIIANVNTSFAIIDEIYRLNNKEFLVQTDKGLYITNRYLNIKKDFTQVNLVDVFVGQKTIVVSQNIKNETKYGAIDLNGKIIVPFVYTSYSNLGNGLCFSKNNSMPKEYVVYNSNNLNSVQVYSQYDYFANGVVVNNDRLIAASTGEIIISKTDLKVKDYINFNMGKSKSMIFTIEYTENGVTKKASIISKEVRTAIEK